jgi:DNA-binding NarL/FixJ family response regulator
VAGRSNQAIADELFISWTTARTHVSHIFRKLGVGTRAEAVDAAHRRGLVAAPDETPADR